MPKLERWVACADNHGNHADPRACGVLLEFLKSWRPTVRIHLGDCFDIAALRKGASDQERRESIRDDIDAGCAFLERFKPTHFLYGNHDQRLLDALSSDEGPLRDLASSLHRDIDTVLGDVPRLPYCKRKGVLEYGDYRFVHGYHTGLNAAANAARAYSSVMMGHTHSIDSQNIATLERANGRCIGALCVLEQPYNRGHAATLRQAQGWAYGLKTPNGKLVVYQAQEIEGRWFFPDGIREVSSK